MLYVEEVDNEEKDYAINARFKVCMAKGAGGAPKCVFYEKSPYNGTVTCRYRNVYRHNESKLFPLESNPRILAICTRKQPVKKVEKDELFI